MTKGIYYQAARMLTKEGNLDHHSMIIQKLLNALDNCHAAKNLHARRSEKLQEQLAAKDIELVRWQQIAQDRTARIGWYSSCNCGRLQDTLKWSYCDWQKSIPKSVRDGWNKWAIHELHLEAVEEAGYVERLEAAFLGSRHDWACSHFDNPDAIKQCDEIAQAALAKIRNTGNLEPKDCCP